MFKFMDKSGQNSAIARASFFVATALLVISNASHAVQAQTPIEPRAVIKTYVEIAHATYRDALTTAITLNEAVIKFTDQPSEKNLAAAKQAWIAARVPYQQTEVFRFGNPIVDAWEGRVNAWPLDEGLIDYVSSDYGTSSEENALYTANVIANKTLKINGTTLNISQITKGLLSDSLQEAGGIEANVATGYHAIEFLLWGQDLGGTGPGAGTRPASDFDLKNCTGGNCDRRVQYLKAALGLLIDDLKWMSAQWAPGGGARINLEGGDAATALIAIFTGMGSLSYGELAGDRIKLGLMLHDPEEEHDCFSDNTHNSHYYDVIGIENIYLGRYRRIDGEVVEGPSPFDLVSAKNSDMGKALKGQIAATLVVMKVMVKRAETIEAYDQMLAEGNDAGNATIQAVLAALLKQTKGIERAVAALNLKSARPKTAR